MMVKKERKDEAVSPVIGVILMVAITVILAAVIGNFVFGFASKMGTAAPNVQAILVDDPDNIDTGTNYVFDIEHAGGDPISCSEMRIFVYNASGVVEILDWDGNNFEDAGAADGLLNLESSGDIGLADGVFNTGDIIKIHENSAGDDIAPGTYEVKIMHIPSQTFIFSGTVTVV
ncbi:MAG: archaeal type pilus assembly protein PilA [Archaeoglobi archaeon]|nr:archaeal type pilus assembly protein PilA [Archaeoglobi archaeon]